jgi:2-polyprenyl-3-methyl-5-hydroxy-6-metoxy-1,4-benzoquinol methylase
MNDAQHDRIRREFRKQAGGWAAEPVSDNERWVVERLDLAPAHRVLDVGAGTGLIARAVAPHAASVVAVDLTPDMLEGGRAAALAAGLTNVQFRRGAVEALPVDGAAFDRVVCRWLIHHLATPADAVREMRRACAPGGQVAVIDIVAPDDAAVAATYNHLERVRDPSHTVALRAAELEALVAGAELAPMRVEARDVPMELEQWLGFAAATAGARDEIRGAIEAELAGGVPTGMQPYRRDGAVWFTHVWRMVTARAEA